MGSNADTFVGSRIKTLKYNGLILKLFSPSNNGKEFWVMSMQVNDKRYKTFRIISIGSTLSELKKAYSNISKDSDGRTDSNNCAYTFNKDDQFIRFEVRNSMISDIKFYVEIP